MRVFVSIFVVAAIVFMYSIMNTGLARFVRPNGHYIDGFQDSYTRKRYEMITPSTFLIIFSVCLMLVISLEYLRSK